MAPAANGEEPISPTDRFALYNGCGPMGVVAEIPGEYPTGAGPSAAQLEGLAESRLQTAGLYQPDASALLHLSARGSQVELRFMKPVIDVASGEEETVGTHTRTAAFQDGSAAAAVVEISKLLDHFLADYRRVNRPPCDRADASARVRRVKPSVETAGAARRRDDAVTKRPSALPQAAQTRGPGPIPCGPILSPPERESDDKTVHKIGSEVSSPRLIEKVEPEYSDQARDAKLEGTVMLAGEIWEDGKAHNIRPVRCLGMGLDENAVEAIKKWVFRPGEKDGRPVRVAAQFQVSFRLVVRDPQER